MLCFEISKFNDFLLISTKLVQVNHYQFLTLFFEWVNNSLYMQKYRLYSDCIQWNLVSPEMRKSVHVAADPVGE